MARTAKADVAVLRIGSNVFKFDDGACQVTEAEEEILRRYRGSVKITFEDEKQTRKGGADG